MFILANLLSVIAAADAYGIDKMYTIKTGSSHSQRFADLTVSNCGRLSIPIEIDGQNVNLYLSMSEAQTHVVESSCEQCKTNHAYNYNKASSRSSVIVDYTSNTMLKFDSEVNKMVSYAVSGTVYQDFVKFKSGVDISTDLEIRFTTIQTAKPEFASDYSDGILGLAPASRMVLMPERSFVYKLKNESIIGDSIVSL